MNKPLTSRAYECTEVKRRLPQKLPAAVMRMTMLIDKMQLSTAACLAELHWTETQFPRCL